MNWKNKLRLIIYSVLLFVAAACNDDDKLDYVDDIVDTSALQIEKQVIVSGDDPLHVKSSGELIGKSDFLILRSDASQAEMQLAWGYEYLGIDENGNRSYDFSSVVAKIDFNDKWEYGKWDLILQRGSQRQVLNTIEFTILDLKKEEGNPEAYVDKSELYKRNLYIYAKGWQNADMDSIEFIDKSTGSIVLTKGSPASAETEDYAKVLLNFEANDLKTGSYMINIRRWQYSFRQSLFGFDYFKIALVDNNPITKNADGRYYIDFYLDEIVSGDKVRVAYGGGKTQYFDEVLSAEHFNAETKIYTILIPDGKIYKGNNYTVSLTRKGTAMTLGAKLLPEDQ